MASTEKVSPVVSAEASPDRTMTVVLVTADTLQGVRPEDAHDEAPPLVWERLSLAVVRATATVTRPLLTPAPLAQLAAGERVPTGDVARTLLWGGVAYPAPLALLAILALRRRELAR